jgi:ankyrin repeat protein
LPPLTEDSFIQMLRLLLEADTKLNGAGIEIDKQDRLGRTVLHLAAQYGLTNLTKTLLMDKAKGGFGANPFVGDSIN